jgi:hypothetical protein
MGPRHGYEHTFKRYPEPYRSDERIAVSGDQRVQTGEHQHAEMAVHGIRQRHLCRHGRTWSVRHQAGDFTVLRHNRQHMKNLDSVTAAKEYAQGAFESMVRYSDDAYAGMAMAA